MSHQLERLVRSGACNSSSTCSRVSLCIFVRLSSGLACGLHLTICLLRLPPGKTLGLANRGSLASMITAAIGGRPRHMGTGVQWRVVKERSATPTPRKPRGPCTFEVGVGEVVHCGLPKRPSSGGLLPWRGSRGDPLPMCTP